jgi:hypothetical protein
MRASYPFAISSWSPWSAGGSAELLQRVRQKLVWRQRLKRWKSRAEMAPDASGRDAPEWFGLNDPPAGQSPTCMLVFIAENTQNNGLCCDSSLGMGNHLRLPTLGCRVNRRAHSLIAGPSAAVLTTFPFGFIFLAQVVDRLQASTEFRDKMSRKSAGGLRAPRAPMIPDIIQDLLTGSAPSQRTPCPGGPAWP